MRTDAAVDVELMPLGAHPSFRLCFVSSFSSVARTIVWSASATVWVQDTPAAPHPIIRSQANGWLLTGEVGKFIPVSNQRIASVAVLPGGGFNVSIKGSPGEAVTMGAFDTASRTMHYATATVGSDGTGLLKL